MRVDAAKEGWVGVAPHEFLHERGHHCGTTALRDMLAYWDLQWAGLPATEAVVFGLSGGLSFVRASDPLPPDPPLYFIGRSETLERDFCANAGLALDLRETDDPADAWRWVRAELEAGRPAMVWADILHLDYLDVRMPNAVHDVVVVAADEEHDHVYVADYVYPELQLASVGGLAAARGSTGFPGPTRHATFLMRPPAELPEPRECVARGIRRALRNLRADDAHLSKHDVGLAALERFAAEAAEWPRTQPDALAALLKRMRFCISKAGNDGAMFRQLQAEFLEAAHAALGDELLAEAAAGYAGLAADWRELAKNLARGRPRERASRCIPLLEAIVEREHACAGLLASWEQDEATEKTRIRVGEAIEA